MNILLACILIVLVLILVALVVSIYKSDAYPKPLWSPDLQAKINDTKAKGDDLQKFASAMLEKLNEEKRLNQEREMMEYAQSKMKDEPLLPSSTNENQNGIIKTNTRGDLVSFSMSEKEKSVLKEFYGNE